MLHYRANGTNRTSTGSGNGTLEVVVLDSDYVGPATTGSFNVSVDGKLVGCTISLAANNPPPPATAYQVILVWTVTGDKLPTGWQGTGWGGGSDVPGGMKVGETKTFTVPVYSDCQIKVMADGKTTQLISYNQQGSITLKLLTGPRQGESVIAGGTVFYLTEAGGGAAAN